MKKRILLALTTCLAVVMLAYAPLGTVFADSQDDAALASTSKAITDLYTFLDDTKDMAPDEFFPKFVDKADATKQVVSRAYADMGQTTEVGDAGQIVQDIRANLADLKIELSAWHDSAVAGDTEEFNRIAAQFDKTTDAYNSKLDAYDKRAPQTNDTAIGITILACAAVLVIVLPIILLVRNKKLNSARKKATTELANKTLVVSPRKFLLLNLLTLNTYTAYWGWKSWEIVAKSEGKKYHSTFRAWFMAFTAFSLFEKTMDFAKGSGYKTKINDQVLAAGILALWFATLAVSKATDNIIILLVLIPFEAIITTLLVRPILMGQAYYVTHVDKPLLPLGKDLWTITLITISLVVTVGGLIVIALGT